MILCNNHKSITRRGLIISACSAIGIRHLMTWRNHNCVDMKSEKKDTHRLLKYRANHAAARMITDDNRI